MVKKYIPEGSTLLQEKFINYVMDRGKKSVARKIFADTLKEIEKSGSKNPEQVFERAIENIKPSMEVRPKRIGGAVYQIPIEVKPKRQTMLAFRWILGAARERKGAPMAKKLAQELLDAANQQGAALKKKEDTHKMAASNKAFAHYARY
ncbi:MAG: hypothetical protein ACD_63C00101G0003 [uncultured bacterium]|nr:MAG: hypothetical protein ACD_63C00101G0003 [uncultured bacterium]